jgi:CO/xanthine dehydrogenase Mo-binding subunit
LLAAWAGRCAGSKIELRTTASNHAHDTRASMRVAVGNDGRVIAIDADVLVDIGAYSAWPATATVEPMSVAPRSSVPMA